MNEEQARREGLGFTGHYSHNKDEQKAHAKEIRDQGFRAIVVNVPTSKLSRGYRGMGYSVYAEQKYFDSRRKDVIEGWLEMIPERKCRAQEEYEEKLAEIAKNEESYHTELNDLKQRLGIE